MSLRAWGPSEVLGARGAFENIGIYRAGATSDPQILDPRFPFQIRRPFGTPAEVLRDPFSTPSGSSGSSQGPLWSPSDRSRSPSGPHRSPPGALWQPFGSSSEPLRSLGSLLEFLRNQFVASEALCSAFGIAIFASENGKEKNGNPTAPRTRFGSFL